MPPQHMFRVFLVLITFLVLGGWIVATTSASDPELAPCPGSFNCVSSLSSDTRHTIAPLRMVLPPAESLACLTKVVGQMKRARIVDARENYLHAEFRTNLGFVDDVEFRLEPGSGVIHMRSASRLGYWDLGENRKRLEAIRKAFEDSCG